MTRSDNPRFELPSLMLGGVLAVCAGIGIGAFSGCAGLVLGDERTLADGGLDANEDSADVGVDAENDNNRCTVRDQRVVWALQFGDASSQAALAVATGGDNLYVAGAFRGALDFGIGPMISEGGLDYFLSRLDANGHPIWSKRFGDATEQEDAVIQLAIAPDGGVLFYGDFRGTIDFGDGIPRAAVSTDGFVSRYDALGTHLWTRVIPSDGQDSITDVAVDPVSGALVVAVRVQGPTADFAGKPVEFPGGAGTLIAKLDPDGNQIWARTFGGSVYEVGQTVAIHPNGNIVVAGNIDSPTDFGGGVEPNQSPQDAFIATYTEFGEFVWAKVYAGPGTQSMRHIAIDAPSGDLIVAGQLAGSVAFEGSPISSPFGGFAARLTSTGEPIVSRAWPELNVVRSLLIDPQGSVVLSGGFFEKTDFGPGPIVPVGAQDGLLVKLGPNLEHLSTLQIGSTGEDNIWGVDDDQDSNLFVGAYFQDTINIDGCGVLTSAGDADVLLMKLRQ